ncbi:MAG: sigma-70 family RNA polymerase sigma factor [Acidobacteria bacterium]|nr:sigma-70 family RNA polymerase sigma factor [Acidobacteriota bacterium]MCZ6727578.1 sigma-70 family RNA polymerase sigma factor [Acidobacteriota bacterium]
MSSHDLDLVARARQGDRPAFREIVDRHQADVFHLALGLLARREDAEDVVQEVFIRAYRSLKSFRGEAGLGTWLYRITMNASRDHQRRHKWMALQESLGVVPDSARWADRHPDTDPERSTASREVRRDVGRALERLSATERRVFVLRHLRQLSVRETAQVLGRAEGTVKNLLFRALRKLRAELAAHRRVEETPS